jgi:hypothetical protein
MNLVSNSLGYRSEYRNPVITLRSYVNEELKTVLWCSDNKVSIDLELHGSKVFGLYKLLTNARTRMDGSVSDKDPNRITWRAN